ncbi:MAG: isochorismatase family protein [bacterium]|nr:isochorismatase family protein [bacterium]
MPHYDQRTALIVVDVQNDFADPEGSLYVSGGEQVIQPINQEIARARRAGALVVYTQDWHPRSTPHFEKDGGIWPVHCVGGEWGAEIHPELDVDGPSIRKGTGGEDGYSGFSTRDPQTGKRSETGLAGLLESHSIERAVVLGLALDYCVKATALDAADAGLSTTVILEATRSVDLNPGDGKRAVEELLAAGIRVSGSPARS